MFSYKPPFPLICRHRNLQLKSSYKPAYSHEEQHIFLHLIKELFVKICYKITS